MSVPGGQMGQPVQRPWGKSELVIKQQGGRARTRAEYGCVLREMRSQACGHMRMGP